MFLKYHWPLNRTRASWKNSSFQTWSRKHTRWFWNTLSHTRKPGYYQRLIHSYQQHTGDSLNIPPPPPAKEGPIWASTRITAINWNTNYDYITTTTKTFMHRLCRTQRNQLIILTTDRQKELSNFSAFPVWTEHHDSNIFEKRKFLCIKILQLINK